MRVFKFFLALVILSFAFSGGLSARYFKESLVQSTAQREFFRAQVADIQGKITKAVKGKAEKKYTLLFVGDIMLSRGVDYYIQKYGNGDYRYPFLNIADTIRSADLAFGNLESPISSRGKNQGSIYSFRANPKAIEGLTFAGFDVVSVANNHIWDWGKEALEDTIQLLTTNDIRPVGAGMNYDDANDPKLFTFNNLHIALFGYTNLMPRSLEATASHAGLSQFEPELIKSSVAKAKEDKADIVIVSLHWGEEYQTRANEFQRKLAHELINAGADLVIGHHPHVVQEVEEYVRPASANASARRGYIAYSIGNFLFDQQFSEETKNGLMLEVKIRDKKIMEVNKIGVHISNTAQVEMVQ